MLKLRMTAATATGLALVIASATNAQAQDGNLLLRPPVQTAPGVPTLENSSHIYVRPKPLPPPQELTTNAIITVLVDYRTRILSEGDAEQRKTASLNTVLADWLKFDGKSIKPAPQSDGDPRINGSLTSQFRAEADLESRDSLTFRMAVRIVDIRPNGNLVLEGHQDIQNNDEVWQLSLTGVVPREAIAPDRTVKSDSIASLRIVKREKGQVRDGYNRGWFQKFYDAFKPF